MNAVRIRTRLDSHVLDLPELAPLIGKTVEIIVLEEVALAPADRADVDDIPPGSAKGTFWMADDFDAPLTEGGRADGPRAGFANGQFIMADDFGAPLEDFKPHMNP